MNEIDSFARTIHGKINSKVLAAKQLIDTGQTQAAMKEISIAEAWAEIHVPYSDLHREIMRTKSRMLCLDGKKRERGGPSRLPLGWLVAAASVLILAAGWIINGSGVDPGDLAKNRVPTDRSETSFSVATNLPESVTDHWSVSLIKPYRVTCGAWQGTRRLLIADDLGNIKLVDPASIQAAEQLFVGHQGSVASIAWNPVKPEEFASVGEDGRILIWSVGNEVFRIVRSVRFEHAVGKVEYSPDGNFLAAMDRSGKVAIVDSLTLQTVSQFDCDRSGGNKYQKDGLGFFWLHDSKTIVTQCGAWGSYVACFSIEGEEVLKVNELDPTLDVEQANKHPDGLRSSLAISSDRASIAAIYNDWTFRVCNLGSEQQMKEIANLKTLGLEPLDEGSSVIKFTRTQLVLDSENYRHTIGLDRGTMARQRKSWNVVSQNQDGTRALVADKTSYRTIDGNGKVISDALYSTGTGFTCVEFHSSGETFCTGDESGRFRWWNESGLELLCLPISQSSILGICQSSSEGHWVAFTQYELFLIDLQSHDYTRLWNSNTASLRYVDLSGAQLLVVTGADDVLRSSIDFANQKLTEEFKTVLSGHGLDNAFGEKKAKNAITTFKRIDTNLIAVGCRKPNRYSPGYVVIGSLKDEKWYPLRSREKESTPILGWYLFDFVTAIDYDSDQDVLVAGGSYGTISVWKGISQAMDKRLPTQRFLFATGRYGETSQIQACTFDRSMLAIGGDSSDVWRLDTQLMQTTRLPGFPSVSPTAIATSALHKLVAVGDKAGNIQVFDQDGTVIDRLFGHLGKVKAISWHPTKRLFVTVDRLGMLQVTDVSKTKSSKTISLIQDGLTTVRLNNDRQVIQSTPAGIRMLKSRGVLLQKTSKNKRDYSPLKGSI